MGGTRVGKGKKEGKRREGARKRKEKMEGGGGEEKKENRKGILAIPILVCFRCR